MGGLLEQWRLDEAEALRRMCRADTPRAGAMARGVAADEAWTEAAVAP